MSRFVSLSEFMPYGAPDLLAAGPRHLSRAAVTSCSLALLAFALATLLPRPHGAPIPEVTLLPPLVFEPPPIQWTEPPPSAGPVPSKPAVGPNSPVLPVPDPAAPEQTFEAAGPSRIGEPDTGPQNPVAPSPEPVAPALPERGTYVRVDELPARLVGWEAEYPEDAIRADVDGTVLVYVLVGTDGHVVRAEADKHQTVMMLEPAALAAARRCVFRPAHVDGRPVAVWISLPFRFTLH